MGIFDLSDGSRADGAKTFEHGSFEPIPNGTDLVCYIKDARWEERSGDKFINIAWSVMGEEYKNRIVFQKLKVLDEKPSKRDNSRRMLAVIDANSGGKLARMDKSSFNEITDVELMQSLANSGSIKIQVGLVDMDDGSKINWVRKIYAKGDTGNGQSNAAPFANKEDDIPF